MTSYELFRLLKFKEYLYFIYIFILFLLKYSVCDKTHQFEKKINNFASNYGIITSSIIKLCKESCRKEKVGGA